MSTMLKIQNLLLICFLVTATLLVSGCTETTDDAEEITDNETEDIMSLYGIFDARWQWSGLIETEPASQSVVPDPGSYTISFAKDGTYSIKADCNSGSGTYTLDGNELTLAPGTITLAYCGPESLDTQYLSLLSNVTTVSIENDQFVLGVGNNGDKMLFVKEEVTDNDEASETLSSFKGTISSIEDGNSYPVLLLESEEIRSSGYENGIKFVISEETAIVDLKGGGLFYAENLKEGMDVRVFFSPELTRSIPPIGQATLVQLI